MEVSQRRLNQTGQFVAAELAQVLPFDRSAQQFLQRQVEKEQIAQRRVVFRRGHRPCQSFAQRRDRAGQHFRGRSPPAQAEQLVELPIQPAIEPAARRGDGAIQVGPRMHRLEDLQEVLELADQGVLAVAVERRIGT